MAIRARDLRAVIFCVVTISLTLILSAALFQEALPVLAVTGAWTVFVLTRPRMLRVMRRLRGDSGSDWSDYFKD